MKPEQLSPCEIFDIIHLGAEQVRVSSSIGGKYVFACYERYLSRRLQVKIDI